LAILDLRLGTGIPLFPVLDLARDDIVSTEAGFVVVGFCCLRTRRTFVLTKTFFLIKTEGIRTGIGTVFKTVLFWKRRISQRRVGRGDAFVVLKKKIAESFVFFYMPNEMSIFFIFKKL
jgi:hypothetical protein